MTGTARTAFTTRNPFFAVANREQQNVDFVVMRLPVCFGSMRLAKRFLTGSVVHLTKLASPPRTFSPEGNESALMLNGAMYRSK